MHNSKLFQLLRTLEASEIRWLYKFLKSPYHNSNPQYTRLFEYIKKCYPDLEHKKLDKKVAFGKLYPKEEFDPQKMRKLMHELAVLVEEFLVIHAIKNNPFKHRKFFIAELGKRNHYKAFEKETNTLLHELEQKEQRSEDHFLERYQLRKQLFAHPLTVRGQEGRDKLLRLSEELDHYFFLQKLITSVALKSNTKIFSSDLELSFVDKVLEKLEAKQQEISIDIGLFKDLNQLLNNKGDTISFTEVKQKYVIQRRYLDNYLSKTTLNFLLNFAVGKLSKGETDLIEDQFELYKIGLKDGFLIQNDRITDKTFSNIIVCGAYLKEYKWTEEFIDNYGVFLDKILRTEIISFNKANLNFKQQKFKEAIEILNRTDFKKILYLINARMLTLECYYECLCTDDSYYDLLMSQIDAFEKFVHRQNNLSNLKKESYLNFAKALRKITKQKFNNQSNQGLEMISSMSVVMKPWLISKIQELQKGGV